MYEAEMEANVRRGIAEKLDVFFSGWLWTVNENTLNLSSCAHCVVGQLSGCEQGPYYHDVMWDVAAAKYDDALSFMGIDPNNWEEISHFGFALADEHYNALHDSGWRMLSATWRRMILEAREQRKLTLASQPLEAETERVLQTAN